MQRFLICLTVLCNLCVPMSGLSNGYTAYGTADPARSEWQATATEHYSKFASKEDYQGREKNDQQPQVQSDIIYALFDFYHRSRQVSDVRHALQLARESFTCLEASDDKMQSVGGQSGNGISGNGLSGNGLSDNGLTNKNLHFKLYQSGCEALLAPVYNKLSATSVVQTNTQAKASSHSAKSQSTNSQTGISHTDNTLTVGELTFPDPKLASCVAQRISDSTLVTDVESIDCNYSGVADLSGLESFTQLKNLSIILGTVTDLTPITSLSELTSLNLSGNRLENISVLANLTNLTTIDIGRNQISDLTPLSQLTDLTSLILGFNRLSDISVLNQLTALSFLDVSGNRITDVSALSGLTGLTILSIPWNYIADISVLSGLTGLTSLQINSNYISDLSALSGMTGLTFLDISDNPITDFSVITGLTNMEWLIASRLNQFDINVVGEMGELAYLQTHHAGITDISVLSGLNNLEYVQLTDNNINDASPLVDMLNNNADRVPGIDIRQNNANCRSLYELSEAAIALRVYNVFSGYNATTCDSDEDGIPDQTEIDSSLDFLNASDAAEDPDNDGFTNLQEYQGNTDRLDSLSHPDADLLVLLSELTFADSALSACISERYHSSTAVGQIIALQCDNDDISDLSGVEGLVALRSLSIRYNQISDLSPIASLTNLIILALDDNQIIDISPLSGLTNLLDVEMSHNQITDISPLASLTVLEWLSVGSNQITDIAPLSGLNSLTRLSVGNNQIVDLSPLSGLITLTYLSATNNQIIDISALSGLTNLVNLYISDNQVSDISGLSELTALWRLRIGSNPITDFGVIYAMTDIGVLQISEQPAFDFAAVSGLSNLRWLFVTSSNVTDISAITSLERLSTLELSDNNISDITPIVDLLATNIFYSIDIDNNDISCAVLYDFLIVQDAQPWVTTESDYDSGTCDSDNDGLPDIVEMENGLDFLDAADALLDIDGDGFSHIAEYQSFSDPWNADSTPEVERVIVDFESDSDLTGLTLNSAFPWTTTTEASFNAATSLRSAQIGDSQVSEVSYTGLFDTGSVSFAYKVSTEEGWDKFRFLIDGTEVFSSSGEVNWSRHHAAITQGSHTLTWQFTKDFIDPDSYNMISYIGGSQAFPFENAVWLDRVMLPIASDSDADGVADFADALPLDAAASVDTDGDGYPDSWNAGYSAADSSTGLVLDEFPNDSQRWTTVDTDGDGVTDDTETLLSLDINDASDVWQDNDGDRLPLLLERQEATNDSNRDNDVFSESRLLVQQAFVDMAGRFATDTEVNDGLTQLSGASSPLDIYVAALDDSSLARLGLVGRIYQALLNRSPDQGGLNFFRRQLQSGGMNNDQIVSGFINSTEFQSRYGNLSNSDFVQLVYQNVLGRSPDPAGLAYWEEQLTSGNTNPTGLMLGFITSQEFIDWEDVAQRLNGLSLVMANRSLSQDDINRYRQWVESEGNYRSVIRELLSSQGYREQLLAGVSDATADSDADGRPDGLEFAQGFDVSLKDNDVLNNDVLFVQQTLRDVVGHRLSLSEEATQLTALQTVNNRSDWVASLISDERVNTNRNAIIRLYNAILGRRSERNGLVFWIERYESGTNTLEDIANAFVGSGEFQSTYGTLSDGDFVDLVYQNVLGRAGDSGGVAYWTSQLDSSAISRGGLMIGFSESSENANLTLNRDRVVVLYTMLLARDPSDSEVDTWREDLNNGTAISILINQILADSDYQARFY